MIEGRRQDDVRNERAVENTYGNGVDIPSCRLDMSIEIR